MQQSATDTTSINNHVHEECESRNTLIDTHQGLDWYLTRFCFRESLSDNLDNNTLLSNALLLYCYSTGYYRNSSERHDLKKFYLGGGVADVKVSKHYKE